MELSHLLIRTEDGTFRRIAIEADRVDIGRDPSCGLHLTERSVSRKHACLLRREGQLVLKDLGSRGGTLLNGARIAGSTALQNADWIRLGGCILLVRDREPTAADEEYLDRLARESGLKSDLEATRVLFSVPAIENPARETATAPQLALLETVSEALRAVTEIEDVLTVLLGVAFDMLGPERGCVLLRNGPGGELVPSITHPEDEEDFASRTLLAHAIERRATIVVRDVTGDERYQAVPSLQLNSIQAAVCCPLISRDEVVGAIYLDTHFEGLSARREEVGLLNFIACFAATAVENALLLRERSRARTLADLDEDPLIARSGAMAETVAGLERHAAGTTPLVIIGERGTGKLLAARHVHLTGRGRDAPFLALDCERVSGRDLRKLLVGDENRGGGAWRENSGGTLVLEHIGALDLLAQNTLVELLELPGGPRLVATSTPAIEEISGFSSRLVQLLEQQVTLPRLRERREDILPLARHFLARAPGETGETARRLGPTAEATLQAGKYKEANVSELRDAIELAVVLTDGPVIEAEQVFTGPKSRAHRLEFDLGSSTIVQWLLRRRVHESFLVFTALLFTGLIVACLAWPDHVVGRVANGLVWGLWWPALLVVFLSAGRLWCTWCPLSRVARWGQALWSLSRRPPGWVKTRAHWLMALLFVAIVWSEHVFQMPERPVATGVFLVTLMTIATATALSTRGEVWCRFACPLGNMSACYSVPATVHVHANPMICQTQCKTHECHKGSGQERGCPVFLHPLYVKDSHFCKLCMACVRNCPNDSAKLWIRPPLQDVWSLAELNPQLVPLALTIFLLAPLMLSHMASPLLFTGLVLLAFAAVIPLRGLLERALSVGDDTMPAIRSAFALAILAWGPLMAFHLGNIPGLEALRVQSEASQAAMFSLPLLPTLQLLAIFGASLAAAAVLGRIRVRSSHGAWWIVHLIVIVYVLLAAGLVL